MLQCEVCTRLPPHSIDPESARTHGDPLGADIAAAAEDEHGSKEAEHEVECDHGPGVVAGKGV